MSSASLLGCGGESSDTVDLAAAADTESRSQALGLYIPRTVTPTPTPPAPTAPLPASPGNLPTGKYRINQPYLFQNVSSKTLPNKMPGGTDFYWDIFGPTNKYVDYQAGWLWTKAGGDWIDAKLTRHGAVPWFSAPVMGAIGAAAVKSYSVDVTAVVSHCFANKRWCAFLLVAKNAARTIAGKFDPKNAAPVLNVTYSNGQKVVLACRMVASSTGSVGPNTTSAQCALPVFVEFERPNGAVKSASMSFVVTAHWSGNNATIDGYLLDPPINAEPVRSGIAAKAGNLDQNLLTQPGILGVHRYVDGAKLAEFVHPDPFNFNAESAYDPAIFERGPVDKTKLPHAGLGKWITTDKNWSLVPSSHAADGFKPLAPGVGALRIDMPAHPGVTDGSIVGGNGSLAGNGMIFLPEPLFGRLDRIFVRYYFRLGSSSSIKASNRKQVYQAPLSPPVWTTCGGKFGIAPDHSTSFGGVSGTSGGGKGWQMRHTWIDCDAGTNGPDEGGWSVGYHLYDYYSNNPKGYNYGGADGNAPEERWGQRGGLGGVFYGGQWYCVETEIKLNTVSNSYPGYSPDGVLRTWVDGKLVYERTGMVFRTLPKINASYVPNQLRPCRELGVKGLWLDWFHGGKTVNTFDRTIFYTGLAWGTQYIGPMQM